jgi:hypothetical protein
MERAGIPTVTLIYLDQLGFFQNTALVNGCPAIRWIDVPRIGQAEEIVSVYYNRVAKALTDPLTAEEQVEGLYQPPDPPRIVFEGTADEAQDFLQQTTLIENCYNCPIAKYTDGLPVIIPTEVKVAEMLTGTSHDGDEPIATQVPTRGWFGITPAGREVVYAQQYTSTVEKAAICAVMAGCKPEYMPAVLAIAEAGGNSTNCPGTSSMASSMWCLSGPYAKEIGMNAGQNALDIGNHANMTLGRVGALIHVNFGGCITGAVRSDSGNPLHSICFAEDLEGLPETWVGWNEEATKLVDTGKKDDNGNPVYDTVNLSADESVIGKFWSQSIVCNLMTFPGYFRTLNQGQMGLARKLGVEGTPGNYNWLEYFLDEWVNVTKSVGGIGFILHPNLAETLYLSGFESKQEVYQWLYDNYFITVEEHYNTGLWEFPYDDGRALERSNPWGLTWGELLEQHPDYELHSFTSAFIVVSDGFQDEHYHMLLSSAPQAFLIDPWR